MNNVILIHYGEISLKGKNQPQFRKKLLNNIQLSLGSIDIDWPISQYRGYLLLTVNDQTRLEAAKSKLSQVIGINWYAPALRLTYENLGSESVQQVLNNIEVTLCQVARNVFLPDKSFKVEVKRSDKRFPGNSVDLEKSFGANIIRHTSWKKVNLRDPDQKFHVEIQPGEVFIHSEKIKGVGGLPVNTAQKVLVMLSGGIDSPVAAFLVARRGCHVDFVHFTASHVQPDEILTGKIGILAKKISEYTLKSKIFVLPSTYFDLAITGKQLDFELILFRRFMVRVAEKLCEMHRMHAIVTGDNLSQVASQTLTNIASTTRAVQVPVLQPLITFEKEEIINLAIQLGTYEPSIQPYKDCCSLFQKNPRTVSDHVELSHLESRIFADYKEMIDRTVEDMFWINCRYGKIEDYKGNKRQQ